MKPLSLRFLPLFAVSAALAWAADVWVAKPYTDWTEKDIQKIMTDSPWSKHVSVTLTGGFGGGPGGGGGGGGRGGRGGGPAGGNYDPGIDGGGGGGGGGGGRGGRGGGGGGGDVPAGGGGPPETDLMIRWRTSAIINQALVKAQYGAEAGTSPEAQKRLQPEEMYYVIWVSGLPPNLRPRDDDSKKALLMVTTLGAKEKEIPASDVQFSGQGRNIEFYFLFPRMTAFTPDDKEVEFATKFGKTSVKAKFNLKNMVVNGKLGL